VLPAPNGPSVIMPISGYDRVNGLGPRIYPEWCQLSAAG
jgi:hypothetical protein